jgi:hypothetical protein
MELHTDIESLTREEATLLAKKLEMRQKEILLTEQARENFISFVH